MYFFKTRATITAVFSLITTSSVGVGSRSLKLMSPASIVGLDGIFDLGLDMSGKKMVRASLVITPHVMWLYMLVQVVSHNLK